MNIRNVTAALAVGAAMAVTGAVAASAAPTPPGSNYTPTAAVRMLDTRTAVGGHHAALAGRQTIALHVAGVDGVPADATAVTFNVTVTQPATPGYLMVYPDGSTPPATSNLNWAAGQTVANTVTVAMTDGVVDFYNASPGSVQVVADLQGWYSAAPVPYVPASPITDDMGGVATVATGGGFVANATAVGTLDMKAGTYQIDVNAKATPLMTSAVQVFPQFFVYDQPKSAAFTGDLFNVGSGPLESGGNVNIDSYFTGGDVVTLDAPTTLYVYAFGYDADRGAGSYALDDLTVSAVPLG